MIERKEIIHREYAEDGKTCERFQFILKDEKGKLTESRFIFKKNVNEFDEISWTMQAFIPDSFSTNLHSVIQFSFGVPKDNMSLEMVCAIGLNLFQNQLKQQIQSYANLDFDIGENIRGM